MAGSKVPPPPSQPPSRPPSSPPQKTPPPPSKPPGKAMTNPPPPGPDPVPPPPPPTPARDLFALAESLGADVAINSGRGGKGALERAPRPVQPDSEGGRAGGAVFTSGAVSGFSLPFVVVRGFNGPVLAPWVGPRRRATEGPFPGSPPGPPPDPGPPPPREPIRYGEGPLYDSLTFFSFR